MLHLLLSPGDGGTAWRHQLAPGESRAGWECVGPHRLAARVGQLLGLPAETASMPDRLAAFTTRLDRDDDGTRSYSASRKHDRFGVATWLLGLRDRLRLAGWSGTTLAGSARLSDLARLEARPEPVPPGLPDILALLKQAVDKAAPSRPATGFTIDLAAPRAAYAPLLLALVDALARAGATVNTAPPDTATASATTDLGRLQRAVVDPTAKPARLAGDGSVLFLEADTPIEAAELCADLLRRRPLDATTLLAAAEPEVLDAALVRQGLPTLGLQTSSALRPHLQILPLRLALAFSPQEPFRAAELLQLPGGPLPGHARRELLDALATMPGVWSPAWNEAVKTIGDEAARRARDDGKDEAAAAEARADLEARIERWFGGERAGFAEGLPAPRAAAITKDVAAFLGTRAAPPEDADAAALENAGLWAHAASVARTLHRVLLTRPPDERLTPTALMQLHELAVGSGAERAPWSAQAGRPAIALHAADVLPGAAHVAWWGFVQDVETAPAPESWSDAERAGLAAAGVTLPAPGAVRALEAWGWRRALLSAKEGVTFVRWRLAGTEVLQPHPFADELETRVAKGGLTACVARSERLLAGTGPAAEGARTVTIPPAPLLAPRDVWEVSPIAVEGVLSASQLRTLLGCPLRWTLRYAGGLRPGRALELPEGKQLLGTFAHRLLQDLLLGPDHPVFEGLAEEDARAWTLRAFDARVATEAAPLVLPGQELELDRARTLVGGAAAALVRYLHKGDWVAVSAEEELLGEFKGHPFKGYADLVLRRRSDGARAVLDLKLSGFNYRRTELESGHGLQLALYAAMLAPGGGKVAPAAYLVLQEGELLTLYPAHFPGGVGVQGPAPEETLAAAGRSLAQWKNALGQGLVAATHDGSGWEEALAPLVGAFPDEKDPGRYAAECGYCHFTALCQVRLGEEDRS